MSENLLCSGQKATNDKYRKGYDQIFRIIKTGSHSPPVIVKEVYEKDRIIPRIKKNA